MSHTTSPFIGTSHNRSKRKFRHRLISCLSYDIDKLCSGAWSESSLVHIGRQRHKDIYFRHGNGYTIAWRCSPSIRFAGGVIILKPTRNFDSSLPLYAPSRRSRVSIRRRRFSAVKGMPSALSIEKFVPVPQRLEIEGVALALASCTQDHCYPPLRAPL